MRYLILMLTATLYSCTSANNKDNVTSQPTLKQGEDIGGAQVLDYLEGQTGNIDFQIDSETRADVSRKGSYKIKGKKYEIFASHKNFQQIGEASWYGPNFHGKLTANGEKYDMHALTAAHKTLPLGTEVLVTNLDNGKKVQVRINDRGPFHGGRIIDLSKAAAKEIGILNAGKGKVHIKSIDE